MTSSSIGHHQASFSSPLIEASTMKEVQKGPKLLGPRLASNLGFLAYSRRHIIKKIFPYSLACRLKGVIESLQPLPHLLLHVTKKFDLDLTKDWSLLQTGKVVSDIFGCWNHIYDCCWVFFSGWYCIGLISLFSKIFMII